MTELETIFLNLVRLGIGSSCDATIPKHTDWESVKSLATRQGLSGIVLDGMERLSSDQRPPELLLLTWVGEVLQGYEQRYEKYQQAIAELSSFYSEHGLKMMLLKGYVCSLDWPKPEHRPSGDIDIWLFGESRRGDAIISREKGMKVDTSEHHHTVFCWRDFVVENHYDFINVHHHRSHKSLEKTLKELGQDDSHFIEVLGNKVFMPTPNLHALFLLRHSMLHFSFGEFSIRQLLDWAFFVKVHGKDVDWNWLLEVLDKHGMMPLFGIFNDICVGDLGFGFDNLKAYGLRLTGVEANLKERVLAEMLSPEFMEKCPHGFVPRVLFKYRRWRSNGWKHKLCYKESMWSAFWSGVWGHILRPKTI